MPLWTDDRSGASKELCPTGLWQATLKAIKLDQTVEPNKMSVLYIVNAAGVDHEVWCNFTFSEAAMGLIIGHFKPLGVLKEMLGKETAMDQAALIIYNTLNEQAGTLTCTVKVTHRLYQGKTYANVYPQALGKAALKNYAPTAEASNADSLPF